MLDFRYMEHGKPPRLERQFFERSTLDVARELLGKTLVFGEQRGVIVETEAYIGQDDPACHAAKGRTKRTDVMFGPGGVSYVYLIYGMYHCLNFVTENDGFPAAVLIRGVNMLKPHEILLDGPGKLCKSMGITLQHNRIDLTQSESFHVLDTPSLPRYLCTPRIGISQGKDRLWRFLASDY